MLYKCVVCMCVCLLVTQLCPTLRNPMDYSPPGSSIHGIIQARTLEWVAISFSRGSSVLGCLKYILFDFIFYYLFKVFYYLYFIWLYRLFIVACRLSLVAAHGLSSCNLLGLCCSEAYGILVPQLEIKLTSPVLEGGFLTTGPPGKSLKYILE